MGIVKEEVFMPVVVAMPFGNLDKAIRQDKHPPARLATSVWSQKIIAIHRTVSRLLAGRVWVNTHNMLDKNLPLGGYKQSGFGRDLSRAAIEGYTELKSVCMSA